MASNGMALALLSALLLVALRPELAGADGICSSVVTPLGYKCQEFEVQTQDGYILSLQRIPEDRAGRGGGQRRQPVLLQHGVLMDGMTWLLNSPDESLAFILADAGFDVWIANTRGTRWSRRHVKLNASSPEYWAWSWDELVAYDLPATVQFVFSHTGQELDYVGHSLGTLIALASFSEGRLVDKLRAAAFLCPVAYLTYMKTTVGILAARAFVGEITEWLGMAEFNPKAPAVSNFLNTLCREPGVDCYDLMSSFTVYDRALPQMRTTIYVYEEHDPFGTEGVCAKPTFRDGVLTKYNYDNRNANVEHYGEASPPVYNMSNIPSNLPLFLSYGGNDYLSDVRDVLHLLDDLKFHDGDKITVQYVDEYAHADFVMGVTAKKIVYDAVVTFFHRQ